MSNEVTVEDLRSFFKLGKARLKCAESRNVVDCFECKRNGYAECQEWRKHEGFSEKLRRIFC